MPRRRTYCQVCGAHVALHTDGTVLKHGDRSHPWECKGSLREPFPATDAVQELLEAGMRELNTAEAMGRFEIARGCRLNVQRLHARIATANAHRARSGK